MADFPKQQLLRTLHRQEQKCQNGTNQQQWDDLRSQEQGATTENILPQIMSNLL